MVIVGETLNNLEDGGSAVGDSSASLAGVEVLGKSVIDRVVELLSRSGVDRITVLAQDQSRTSADGSSQAVSSTGVWGRAKKELEECATRGDDCALIVRLGSYAEVDAEAALTYHREHGQSATRACNYDGPLEFWIVNPNALSDVDDLGAALQNIDAVPYETSGYVNHLESAQDLRQLVIDSFNGKCQLRPQAVEVRPGVWIAEGAEVEKGARIVAPAFIGRNATVSEQSLVTRCSNIERNSHVDYGTVVEDSSVLPNTYVGIGLDLTHSIVEGNNLLNLHHGVVLKISDPAVMRHNQLSSEEGQPLWALMGAHAKPKATEAQAGE